MKKLRMFVGKTILCYNDKKDVKIVPEQSSKDSRSLDSRYYTYCSPLSRSRREMFKLTINI